MNSTNITTGTSVQNSLGLSYFRCMKKSSAIPASTKASTSRAASRWWVEICIVVRNVSMPTMHNKPTQIAMYSFIPGPSFVSVTAAPPSFFGGPASAGHVHQIQQRKHKHPDQVDEVPVEAGGFDVPGVQPLSVVTDGDHDERDHAGNYMHQVQAGDAEKSSAEHHSSTQRILREAPTLAKHVEPLAQVKRGKNDAQHDGRADPKQGRRFAALLCGSHGG